jgi:hypothetical protein
MSDRETAWQGFQVPRDEGQVVGMDEPTIGKDLVRAEVVKAVTKPGRKVVLAVGTLGTAKRLYPESDRVMFVADSGQRTIVPLAHLRVLSDAPRPRGEHGG